MAVETCVDVKLVDDAEEIAKACSPLGKPFLRLTFSDGVTKDVSTNLGEMIGGAAAGLRLRHQDKLRGAH